MRRRLSACLSLILAAAMILTALPQTVEAADTTVAGVKYIYQDDDPSTGIRTGIESIKLDGVMYYDLEQGRGSLEPLPENEIEFYKKALTSQAATAVKNSSYQGKSNALDQWAELAEKVFDDNSYYTADINEDGSFEENFGQKWGQAGYTDISKALASETSSSSGSEGCDYTIVSGLNYANHLSDVRQKSCKQIRDMINTYSLCTEYDDNNNTFYDHTAGDNTMKALNDNTEQDVLYTMVTCIDEEGDTYAYHYNTYVLAFYDFKLVPLAGDGLSYITSMEGYDSLEDASKAKVKGVSYQSTVKDNTVSSYYENESKVATNITLSLNQSSSETASCTMSSSESYSYSEAIGYELKLVSHHILPVASEETVKLDFSAGQVFNTATSDTKSISNSTSMNVSASLSLPAQTAATIETSSGKTDLTLGFKCPVGVTYKVAMASMSGKLYADRWLTMAFKTLGYTQKTFSTVFGSDSTKSGLTARESLYNRTSANRGTQGYEESYGNTYAYRNRHGGDENTNNTIDWDCILDGDIEIDPKEVTYSIIYKEVDANGRVTDRELNVEDGDQEGELKTGYAYYEVTENAPSSYSYSYTDQNGKTITEDYDLYYGSVTDEDGEPLDNSYADKSKRQKMILLDDENYNKLYFYYVKRSDSDQAGDVSLSSDSSAANESTSSNITANESTDSNITADESTSGNITANESTDSTDDAESVDTPQDTPLSAETLRKLVSWLCVSTPMSSTGSQLTYSSEGTETSIGEIVPLYALKSIWIDNAYNVGNMVVSKDGNTDYIGYYYDANDLLDLTIYPGDKFVTNNLNLSALNTDGVAFYGFNYVYGYWKAVKKNSNGEWVEDRSTNIAELKTDELTSTQYVEAGEEEGSYYIQYFINDNKYRALHQTSYSTNDEVVRPVVRLNVKKAPFDGSLSISGSYTGRINADPADLNEELNVFVADKYGNRISKDVNWEAQETKGISLTPDGQVTFTKTGTYHVRVSVENTHSDWFEIKAEVPDVSSKISGSYTAIVGAAQVDLDDHLTVTFEDATGKEIAMDYSWDAKELNGISLSSDGKLQISKAGSYHVRVYNELGIYSGWFEIKAVEAGSASGGSSAHKTTSAAPISIAKVKKSGKSVKVSWMKVAGASGYEVYGSSCSSKKFTLIKRVAASRSSLTVKKIAKKALSKSCYKFYVKAYKKVNGKKVYLTSTPQVHVRYKTSKTYANATKLTLKGQSSLKAGKSFTLKTKVTVSKGKKQDKKLKAVRYLSSDKAVATVSSKGKVTGKKAGSCYIYAYTVNGISRKIKVTVK